MKIYHEKIYRLVKANDFFRAHGHKQVSFLPRESLTQPLLSPDYVTVTQYGVTVAPVLRINYNVSKTELRDL